MHPWVHECYSISYEKLNLLDRTKRPNWLGSYAIMHGDIADDSVSTVTSFFQSSRLQRET